MRTSSHYHEDKVGVVTYAKKYVDKDLLTKIVDPRILEGRGIEQKKQLRAFVALALRCFQGRRKDRPEMIQVAKELRQIERYSVDTGNFTVDELSRATNYFDEHQVVLDHNFYKIYKGSMAGHPILVKRFAATAEACSMAICDKEITSQVSNYNNVARLCGYCLESEGPTLVYEYSGDKPLNNFLYDRETASGHEDRSLSWRSRLRIAKDIANTIVYLHTALPEPIVHRDLNPSNIMVDQYGVAKLFNFSLSILISPGESRVKDIVSGTPGYIDPEYIISGFVTEKSDVFGFGILLLVLLTGKQPFFSYLEEDKGRLEAYVKKYVDKHQFTKILDPKILKGGGIEQEEQLRAFLALALKCVQERREDRPEMIEVAKKLGQIERYNVHTGNFTADELSLATNYFDKHQVVLREGYKGSLEEHLILVKRFAATAEACSMAIRDEEITLQMSSHKNIVRLVGSCLEFEGPTLLYEYFGDEPLNNFLYNKDTASGHEDRSLSWKSRLRIAKDIANAVVCPHTALPKPIVHRDLKPSKIMEDQNGVAKLFDFSVSISISPGESGVEDTVVGTSGYVDPENMLSAFVTKKSDVFGFGILLLVLLKGKQPFSSCLEEDKGHLEAYVKKYVDEDQFMKILDPRILEGGGIVQEQQLRAFLTLALRCVQKKGKYRPEMIEVAEELGQIERSIHPFLLAPPPKFIMEQLVVRTIS